MRYLLDRLHTELMTLIPCTPVVRPNSPYVGSPLGKSSVVTAIFGGILQSEVNCLICSMESKKHDPFLGALFSFPCFTLTVYFFLSPDLSLDIPTKFTAKSPNPKNGEIVCDLNGELLFVL
jgi:ubiquitin carboxyl-terminal hydrolase 3